MLLSWKHSCLQLILSSPPASLLVPSVTDVTLFWHLSALPLLSHCPISFSVGWNCLFFGGLFMGGRNTPLLQAASSLSAHHTEHDSPPSLWCWDELFLPVPMGSRKFSAWLSPSWTSLQDSGSILCARANATCFGPCTQTLSNFAVIWFEVMYLFSPKGNECFIERTYFFPPPHINCPWMEIQFWLKQVILELWVLEAKKVQTAVKVNQRHKIPPNLNTCLFYLLSFSLTLCNYHVICTVWTIQLVIIAVKLSLNSGKRECWKDYDWPVNGNDVKSDTDNL